MSNQMSCAIRRLACWCFRDPRPPCPACQAEGVECVCKKLELKSRSSRWKRVRGVWGQGSGYAAACDGRCVARVGVGGAPSYSRADIYRDGVSCDGTSVAIGMGRLLVYLRRPCGLSPAAPPSVASSHGDAAEDLLHLSFAHATLELQLHKQCA